MVSDHNATMRSTLAASTILANIFQASYQLIDTFWSEEGDRISVSIPVIFLTIALGMGLAVVNPSSMNDALDETNGAW